jgi:hypothetical protein
MQNGEKTPSLIDNTFGIPEDTRHRDIETVPHLPHTLDYLLSFKDVALGSRNSTI